MFLLNRTALLLSHTDKESSECIFCNLKHIACHLLTPQIISILVIDCFQYSEFKSGGTYRKADLPIDILCLITVQVLKFVASMPSGTIDYAVA